MVSHVLWYNYGLSIDIDMDYDTIYIYTIIMACLYLKYLDHPLTIDKDGIGVEKCRHIDGIPIYYGIILDGIIPLVYLAVFLPLCIHPLMTMT